MRERPLSIRSVRVNRHCACAWVAACGEEPTATHFVSVERRRTMPGVSARGCGLAFSAVEATLFEDAVECVAPMA